MKKKSITLAEIKTKIPMIEAMEFKSHNRYFIMIERSGIITADGSGKDTAQMRLEGILGMLDKLGIKAIGMVLNSYNDFKILELKEELGSERENK